jgi:molybdopterin converting factor small subunit
VKVTVVCFGAMRGYLPENTEGNKAEISVREEGCVADAITVLGAPAHLVFSALVDGTQARLDQKIEDGSEVTLMPPFAGGSTGWGAA